MPWLIIAGAGYLVVSTAVLLAMCRAAALGDAQRGLRGTHSQPRPHPHPPDGPDGPQSAPRTPPLDVVS